MASDEIWTRTVSEWSDALREIRRDMATLSASQQQTALTLEKVSTAYQVSHSALETEMRERAKSLSQDIADVAGDFAEFRRRQEGSPQRMLAWVAAGLALASFLLTGTGMAVGGVVWLILTLGHH